MPLHGTHARMWTELVKSSRNHAIAFGQPYCSSGSPALVTMMKTTDLRDRKNWAGLGPLYIARFRTVFLES